MLRPKLTRARNAAPGEAAQTSLPSFWSTLPVMPGRSTTTSVIGLLGMSPPLPPVASPVLPHQSRRVPTRDSVDAGPFLDHQSLPGGPGKGRQQVLADVGLREWIEVPALQSQVLHNGPVQGRAF